MQFAVAVLHAVENLDAAAEFFGEALGFQRQDEQGNKYLLNNGAISIRLISGQAEIERATLNLELYCEDLDATCESMLRYSGISVISEPAWVDQYKMQSRLHAPHNLVITLSRNFNEDELGITPPLPTTQAWEERAETCIRDVLKQIPLGFRSQARIRITEQAEMISGREGSIRVSLDHAVRSLAETTPNFQHPTLCVALSEMGIDAHSYFEGVE